MSSLTVNSIEAELNERMANTNVLAAQIHDNTTISDPMFDYNPIEVLLDFAVSECTTDTITPMEDMEVM
jgi:hypothetical protein